MFISDVFRNRVCFVSGPGRNFKWNHAEWKNFGPEKMVFQETIGFVFGNFLGGRVENREVCKLENPPKSYFLLTPQLKKKNNTLKTFQNRSSTVPN